MSENLYPVCRNGRWGYVDRKGTMIIQPAFQFAGPFCDGRARVNSGGQPGLHGLVGGNWGFLDGTGRIVIPLIYQDAEDFREGLAAVNLGARMEYAFREDAYYMLGGHWGFVDTTGATAIPITLDAVHSFHGGLAVARRGLNDFGFLNRAGEWVIEPRFRFCLPFSEGLAAVSYNDKYGFIDDSGTMIIPARYRLAYSFLEGTAPVLIGETYSWSYIQRTGHTVFAAPEGVTHVGEFHQDLACGSVNDKVRLSDGQYYASARNRNTGFFNRKGEWVIPPQFDLAGNFHEDRAWVRIEQHYGYIRLDGSRLNLPDLSEAGDFRNGLAPVRIQGSFHLIDRDGNIVWKE